MSDSFPCCWIFRSDIRIFTPTSRRLRLPNRFRMLIHLRRHPEIHDRLLFGTDYPLSVMHVAAWGRLAFRTLGRLIRTTNRFDRQYAVCTSLGVAFKSFEALLEKRPQSP